MKKDIKKNKKFGFLFDEGTSILTNREQAILIGEDIKNYLARFNLRRGDKSAITKKINRIIDLVGE